MKKVRFWLFIALSLPVVTGCSKPDPKVSELEADVKKLRAEVRAEVVDREWEIAALKAKLGEPGAEAAKRRDLLIGKWAGVEAGKTKRMNLEFTRDGKVRDSYRGKDQGEGVLGDRFTSDAPPCDETPVKRRCRVDGRRHANVARGYSVLPISFSHATSI